MWFQGGTLPPFFAHDRTILPDLGYLLLDYVEDGKMLSSSWREHREDPQKRKNLYSSLARIMLDLSKVPLPRIGSWTMDNKGAISLTNRPFHDLAAIWNRHGIPLHVPRDLTYSSAESYIYDLLGYQDIRMRYQLNSLLDRNDGISKLSSIVGLRAILPQLYKSRLTRETFTMNFPDLHQSNIFVDEDWNISRIIDFEFAYSCPSELIHVPSWLTSRGVDQLDGPDEEEYKILYDQFVEAVVTQETLIRRSDATSKRLREDWTSGRLWSSIALGSLNAFPTVFGQHLRPRFYKTWDFYVDAWPLAQMWAENVTEFLDTKVRELPEYDNKVCQVFSEVAESQGVSKAQPAEAPPDYEKLPEVHATS
nr:hypothetical protein CFP56_00464 [Quercus suber]